MAAAAQTLFALRCWRLFSRSAIVAAILAVGIAVPLGAWVAVAVLGSRVSSLAVSGHAFVRTTQIATLSSAAVDVLICALLCFKFVRLRQYVKAHVDALIVFSGFSARTDRILLKLARRREFLTFADRADQPDDWRQSAASGGRRDASRPGGRIACRKPGDRGAHRRVERILRHRGALCVGARRIELSPQPPSTLELLCVQGSTTMPAGPRAKCWRRISPTRLCRQFRSPSARPMMPCSRSLSRHPDTLAKRPSLRRHDPCPRSNRQRFVSRRRCSRTRPLCLVVTPPASHACEWTLPSVDSSLRCVSVSCSSSFQHGSPLLPARLERHLVGCSHPRRSSASPPPRRPRQAQDLLRLRPGASAY